MSVLYVFIAGCALGGIQGYKLGSHLNWIFGFVAFFVIWLALQDASKPDPVLGDALAPMLTGMRDYILWFFGGYNLGLLLGVLLKKKLS